MMSVHLLIFICDVYRWLKQCYKVWYNTDAISNCRRKSKLGFAPSGNSRRRFGHDMASAKIRNNVITYSFLHRIAHISTHMKGMFRVCSMQAYKIEFRAHSIEEYSKYTPSPQIYK